MSLTEMTKTALEAPLVRSNVKSRQQGGRGVSYIEGWHAIAEANRIFGFDGWSRETIDAKCVAEKEREIGQQKAPGWGVTYTCKVRIEALGKVRDGCGSGHGIDRDLGQAHESAIKEAETDAMKRALMTFGNQFGLALYDKEQNNVEDEAKVDWSIPFMADAKAMIKTFDDEALLRQWWASEAQKNSRREAELSKAQVDELIADLGAQIKAIQAKAAA